VEETDVEEKDQNKENSLKKFRNKLAKIEKMVDEADEVSPAKELCPVQEVTLVRKASPAREVLLVDEVPPVEEVLSVKEA
jgi:hypothetical protein